MPRRALALTLLASCVLVSGQAKAADISPAETQLFLDEHLRVVKPPSTLRYGFEETIGRAAPVRAELELTLTARSDGGCCAVSAEQTGGPAFAVLPTLEDAKANPVILYFLEREIRQMQGMTGGQSSHFRRLIRLALAESAQLRDTTIRYGGRDLPAREIRIEPYRDDPRRFQYPALAGKAYVFVLADQIAGGVYQIRSIVLGSAAGAPPLAQSLLTLAEERTP